MQNIWTLIDRAFDIPELHQLAVDAKSDLAAIKLKIDAATRDGPDYKPEEYPKMVGNKVVYNAAEENALNGVSAPVETESEDVGYTGSTP